MGNLRLTLVSITAVLLAGCGSGPATTQAGGQADMGKSFDSKAKPGGAGQGATAKASSAMLGPGAADADVRVGSKVH